MSWNQSFVDSLDGPSKSIEYALRFIGYSNDYFLGAGGIVSTGGMINIGAASVTIDNARITPQRWSVNFGGFTIQINGDLRPIDTSMFRRGAIAELFMRRNRQQPERVAIGQLRSLSGGRGVWRLEFGDFISALTTRLSTKKDELSFYYNAGSQTEVTSGHIFTFGGSPADRLYLDDITSFEKDSNYDGMCFVDDGSSTSYYRWNTPVTTSAPAGYLTITDTGQWPATSSLNTLPVGAKVTSLVRLQARADYIFARTIMSTGVVGAQGWADDYPKSWGSGVDWDTTLINKIDMDLWYGAWATASGTHELQLVIDKAQSSGIRYLLNSFLQIGMWPVFRQGMISWRVCQDPESAANVTISAGISDRDIIAIESHAMYSTSQSTVHGETTIITSSAGGSVVKSSQNVSNVKALPANNSIERDNSLIYRIDSPVQSSKAVKDLARMAAWDLYTYEELTLALHERFAGLVAGDIVGITSSYIYGFNDPSGKTYRGKRGMILGNRWLPNQSRCIITVGIIGK